MPNIVRPHLGNERGSSASSQDGDCNDEQFPSPQLAQHGRIVDMFGGRTRAQRIVTAAIVARENCGRLLTDPAATTGELMAAFLLPAMPNRQAAAAFPTRKAVVGHRGASSQLMESIVAKLL